MTAPDAEALRALFDDTIARLAPADLVAEALVEIALPGQVVVVAVGKAALAMSQGAVRALGPQVVGGLVVVPEPGTPPARLDLLVASHPVPDASSERAGRGLLATAAAARPDQQLLALVSGGASALAAVPAPGLTLADKSVAITEVARSGATIGELNTVRRHLSAIKGGRLAAAAVAPVTTLIISDVAGDDLAAVGSGPTVLASTRNADAAEILSRRVGWGAVPSSVHRHLAAPAPVLPPRSRDRVELVAGIATLVDRAAAAAALAGHRPEPFAVDLSGEVTEVAHRVAALARCAASDPEPRCLIGGGEPTVRLPPNPGIGGRAQHLALLVAREIRGDRGIAVLCAGSDGIDGNSPAAGAVVDGATWDAVAGAGISPGRALDGFDAGTALAAVGAAVVTGRTGVNHADLVVILSGGAAPPRCDTERRG